MENRIEVPGTPAEVWEAIATGHGIEAWFVPAEVEPRVGGKVALDMGMGGGLEDSGVVTAWQPPHRFAYEEEWPAAEGEPPARLASEFLVEAQSGGTCVVRLVSTLQGEGDHWDGILEDLHAGWEGYLLILRLHREHFAAQRCTTIMASGGGSDSTFASLLAGLGIEDPELGGRVESTRGPRLAGTVEHRGERELIVRTDAPAPGVALLFAFAMGELVRTHAHLYLYGAVEEGAADEWSEWMAVPSAG
jgi:uncharacterized protein YndB with AHSA1/START domain